MRCLRLSDTYWRLEVLDGTLKHLCGTLLLEKCLCGHLLFETGKCGVDTAPPPLRVRGQTRSPGAVFGKTRAAAACVFRPKKVVFSMTFNSLIFKWGSVPLAAPLIFWGGGFVRAPCPPLIAYKLIW